MKLSPPEFAKALRKGRGAALQHVLAHGLDGVEDLVLRACLEDQVYDAQCEGNRAAWLYRMIERAPSPLLFSDAFVAALRDPPDDCYLLQLYELASMLGQRGDSAVASALRDVVWATPDRVDAYHAIVALDGIPAVVHAARNLGRLALETPHSWISHLDDLTEGGDLYHRALAELTRLSPSDRAIAAYLDTEHRSADEVKRNVAMSDQEKQERKEARRNAILSEYPVERILAAAADWQSAKNFQFRRFGQAAHKADLERVLDQLGGEPDVDACLRLLWVFGDATLPRMHARVLAFAHDSRADLRQAAVLALASLGDPVVGELGRQRLRDAAFSIDSWAEIELFAHNYQSGDEALILAALARVTGDDFQLHRLGTSVERVCVANDTPALTELALWLYRSTPCTICRKHAIEMLRRWERLPAAIAEEWRYDAAMAGAENV